MRKFAIEEFRQAARNGTPSDAMVVRDMPNAPQAQAGSAGSRIVSFVFSDGSVDRAGDKIDQKGWQLDAFLKNPVILFAHRSDEPPIGRAKGVHVKNNKLMGDVEFAPAGAYDLADVVFRLVRGGFLNATSVGFRPLDWKFTSDKDRPLGIDFVKSELLEISLCPVPCNPNALVEARAKGIDVRACREWTRAVEAARLQRVAEAAAIARAARRMLP